MNETNDVLLQGTELELKPGPLLSVGRGEREVRSRVENKKLLRIAGLI